MHHESTEDDVPAQPPVSLIALSSVTKNFGPNTVLDGIDFELFAGEIQALVGENGAGKSTCLGLLYGLHQPSTGQVTLNSEPVRIENASQAQSMGIGCVFQELSLAGSLSVAENIFAGRAPSRCGFVNWAELRQQATALLAEFDLSIDVSQTVDSLPISSRQIVEIAKALSLNSRILLLDEPTSALTPDEVDGLFIVLRKLVKKGIGIVYVSHHMSEVFAISDRITVLRDGHTISTNKTTETSQEKVVSEMIGGAHPGDVDRQKRIQGEDVLDVQELSKAGIFDKVSFSAKQGEILGLAGLLGSRRSDIMQALIGLDSGHTGTVRFHGNQVAFKSIREAMRAGIGYVPEERKTDGLFLGYPLSANLIACSLEKHSKTGMVSARSITSASRKAIDAFSVKTQGTEEIIGSLSGGNQQKILLAKWLERDPQLLIIEEPTKGVDVGAKFQIHTELRRRAANGMTIIIVSSDFPELVSLSDRIVVIHEGSVVGEIDAEDANEDELLRMAAAIPVPAHNSIEKGI